LAAGLRGDAPGIFGLLNLIDRHQEAVEYDLITHGLRLDYLGTDDLTWRDLKVIIGQQPTGSAVSRAIDGNDYVWDLKAQLLARIADDLAVNNWLTSGGKKSRNPYPKPIERPGTRPERYGKDPIAIDDMADWLGWERPSDGPHLVAVPDPEEAPDPEAVLYEDPLDWVREGEQRAIREHN